MNNQNYFAEETKRLFEEMLENNPKKYLEKEEVETLLNNHFSMMEKLFQQQTETIQQLQANDTKTAQEVVQATPVKVEWVFAETKKSLKEKLSERKQNFFFSVKKKREATRLFIKNGINKRVLAVNNKLQSFCQMVNQKFALEVQPQALLPEPKEVATTKKIEIEKPKEFTSKLYKDELEYLFAYSSVKKEELKDKTTLEFKEKQSELDKLTKTLTEKGVSKEELQALCQRAEEEAILSTGNTLENKESWLEFDQVLDHALREKILEISKQKESVQTILKENFPTLNPFVAREVNTWDERNIETFLQLNPVAQGKLLQGMERFQFSQVKVTPEPEIVRETTVLGNDKLPLTEKAADSLMKDKEVQAAVRSDVTRNKNSEPSVREKAEQFIQARSAKELEYLIAYHEQEKESLENYYADRSTYQDLEKFRAVEAKLVAEGIGKEQLQDLIKEAETIYYYGNGLTPDNKITAETAIEDFKKALQEKSVEIPTHLLFDQAANIGKIESLSKEAGIAITPNDKARLKQMTPDEMAQVVTNLETKTKATPQKALETTKDVAVPPLFEL